MYEYYEQRTKGDQLPISLFAFADIFFLFEQIFSDLEAHPRSKPSGIQLKAPEESTSSKFKAECCEGV